MMTRDNVAIVGRVPVAKMRPIKCSHTINKCYIISRRQKANKP